MNADCARFSLACRGTKICDVRTVGLSASFQMHQCARESGHFFFCCTLIYCQAQHFRRRQARGSIARAMRLSPIESFAHGHGSTPSILTHRPCEHRSCERTTVRAAGGDDAVFPCHTSRQKIIASDLIINKKVHDPTKMR